MKRLALAILLLTLSVAAWSQTAGHRWCDVNGDTEVDITDANILLNIILGKEDPQKYDGQADIDQNSEIDINDLNMLINEILGRYIVIDYGDAGTYRNIELPLVEINTIDNEMPTCDIVDHPAGSYGHSVANATKVPGRMTITLLGDTLYDSKEYVQGESGMTIKINGNTSARNDSKPYKIKLSAKADLLARGDSIYNDKDWRLIRDDQHLNTILGLKTNELAGLQWTPQGEFCNVFINGQYQGTYMLIETVKRNTKCRLNVSKTGYIIERDAYWWNEDVYFKSTYFNDGHYGWTFKEPDADDISDEQIEYIRQCVNDAEQAIADGTYPTLIDLPSFASWLLAHDILGTWDCGGSNLYLTKYDNTPESKFAMGCLWDFDSNCGMGTHSWSRYHTAPDFYFAMLLASDNDAFKRAYCDKWDEISNGIREQFNDFFDDFAASTTAKALNTSRKYHSLHNKTGKYNTPANNAEAIKEYLAEHLDWLEKQIANLRQTIRP